MSRAADLPRVGVRIEPHQLGTLTDLAARLFAETQVEHSQATIVRGLLALGIASLDGVTDLARAFEVARLPRGRKPNADAWAGEDLYQEGAR